MKNQYFILHRLSFLSIFLICTFFTASAYRLTDDDVVVQNGVITQCTYDISTLGNIIEIPETLDGQTITGLGNNCFQLAGKIKEVTLPATLKRIGTSVFREHNLTHVVLPEGIEHIGRNAFEKNNIVSVNLPVSLKTIGDMAFKMNMITNIIIPPQLNIISQGAFSSNNIEILNIPDNITIIGGGAFSNNKINELQIPNTITEIHYSAFMENELEEIEIPRSITVISQQVFSGNNIKHLVIPENIISIENSAFRNNSISSLTISKNLESIGHSAFMENNIETLIFEQGSKITSIPAYCFKDNRLRNLNLPGNIKTIDDEAFSGNRDLSYINFNDSLLKIEKYAFSSCNLGSVELPNSLIYIAKAAFINNPLNSITLPNQVQGDYWLSSDGTILNNGDVITSFEYAYIVPIHYTLKDEDVKVNDGAITECTYTSYIGNKGNVIAIPEILDGQIITGVSAFGNHNILKVNFPETVKYISGFAKCDIYSVSVPASVISIGRDSFYDNCITSISFDSNSKLEFIDYRAFSNNYITSLVIPSSVKRIGTRAFLSNRLSSVIFEEASQLIYIEEEAFSGNNLDKIILPEPEIEGYQFRGWLDGNDIIHSSENNNLGVDDFDTFYRALFEYTLQDDDVIVENGFIKSCSYDFTASMINIPDTLDGQLIIGIGPKVFEDKGITDIALPSNLKYVELMAFRSNNLSQITFPETIEYISTNAFSGNNIKTIHFEGESNLKSIGNGSFGSNRIDSLIIPKSVEYIGDNAFSFNYSINYLEFEHGSMLSYIGRDAFAHNIINNNLILPYKLKEIGEYAFWSNRIEYIQLNESLTDIGRAAFTGNPISYISPLPEPITIPFVTWFIRWRDSDDNTLYPGDFITNFGRSYHALIDEYFHVKVEVKDDMGMPIEGATIQFSDSTMVTDAAGVDSIAPVLRGDHNYTVSADGYITETGSVDVQDDVFLQVTLNQLYDIFYELNGGQNASENPTSYNASSDTIFLQPAVPTINTAAYFAGWYDSNDQLIQYIPTGSTGDITLSASFSSEPTFFITYKNVFDGTHSNPYSYTSNNLPLNLNNAGRENFDFMGWYADADYTSEVINIASGSAENITLYAKWALKSYNIDYEVNGGINNSENPTIYNTESPDISFLPPSKVAYNFDGWYVDEEYEMEIQQLERGSSGDTTLYAKWTPQNYNIEYVLNGGAHNEENPGSYHIESADIDLQPAHKNAYVFEGWYADEQLTNQVVQLSSGSMGDTTLYAKWSPQNYNIQYELSGGSNAPGNPGNYNIETPAINLQAPTQAAYTFDGWYADAPFTQPVNQIPAGSYGDTTLYAKWEPITYSIQYVLNGGTNPVENPVSYTIENTPVTFATPTRTDHTFDGWYADEAFSNEVGQIDAGSFGDTTLYAKWSLANFDINYVMNGGINAGENPDSYSINGPDITFATPTHNGYSFMGWYTDAQFTTEIQQITTGSTGDTTLYANWQPIEYAIQYELGGGINSDINPGAYTVESANINLQPASKTGYDFIGWYTAPDFNIEVEQINTGSTGDTTLYAQWKPVSYTITYILDGGANAPDNPVSYTIETPATELQPAQREGYLFEGWYTGNDFTQQVTSIQAGSTGNVSLYAKWEQLYMLTFNITTDGTTPAQDVTVLVNQSETLLSGVDGQAELQCHDNFDYTYKVELDNIEITSGEGLIEGSGQVVDVSIVDAYMRWYDVLFCDNGKQLWSEFEWSDANNVVSTEQFYHNEGGIESGQYWLNVTSQSGKQYTWTKYYENNQFKVAVYPNPVSKSGTVTVNIEGAGQLGNCELRVYNFTGQMVKTIDKVSANNQIRFSGELPNGLYQVVLFENGRHRSSHQLIVR